MLGHEMVGEVFALGDGVETDSLGHPLKVGDRIVYAYFYPCRRCPACTNGQFHLCPNRLSHSKDSADDWPHLNGGFADYYYLRPGHFVFKVPDELSDAMVAPANCALSQVIHSLRQAHFGFGDVPGHPGRRRPWACTPPPWPAPWAPPGSSPSIASPTG